jgi:tetratricopeptide (TPR) repeat protein
VAALAPALDPKAGETAMPEALHLQATLLLQLGRRAEALTAVERLLSAEYAQRDENPERWQSWQRVTGNQLANEFYEQGDASSALAIYRTLAALDGRAEWRLAISYQIGLCLERLSATADAIKSYREIVEAGNQPAASAQVADLARMAAWRVRHLQWRSRATTQWQELSQGAVETPPPVPSPRADASPTS